MPNISKFSLDKYLFRNENRSNIRYGEDDIRRNKIAVSNVILDAMSETDVPKRYKQLIEERVCRV